MHDQNTLDVIHHVAIAVTDIAEAVEWYTTTFTCTVRYQDDTWALLEFANLNLALVTPTQHPPHIGVATPKAETFGPLQTHRDGVRYLYLTDPFGNTVELLEPGERSH